MEKPLLTVPTLIQSAQSFCASKSVLPNELLYGVTDGKAVGTMVEHAFRAYLAERFTIQAGNSAKGIDLPSEHINTDIKVTSMVQPQSSCPFRDARQKIFGLGYNLLVFVYDKKDDPASKTALLRFMSCSFIEKERTGDFITTRMLRQMLENEANEEDVIAYLSDRNIPADEVGLTQLARQILQTPPEQGYLTISNALQWRLQYGRIVNLNEPVQGITRIVHQPKK